MNWYKENIALQAELRREYPAVAELIAELEQQLADERHDCADLALQVAQLEQQLSRYQSKYNNLLAVAHRDGGHYLAQYGEEKAGEAAITAILTAYHSNDRYQGGVEVEGYVARSGLLELDDILPDTLDSQRVRVLVMPDKEVE